MTEPWEARAPCASGTRLARAEQALGPKGWLEDASPEPRRRDSCLRFRRFPLRSTGKSRAAFLAAPRLAPVDSFPPERLPPLAPVGEGKPADGYFVDRGRYVPGSGLRKIRAPDERPSRRIKRAATPASDSDVSRSGPTEKPRGL
jgi:hypothetical protein